MEKWVVTKVSIQNPIICRKPKGCRWEAEARATGMLFMIVMSACPTAAATGVATATAATAAAGVTTATATFWWQVKCLSKSCSKAILWRERALYLGFSFYYLVLFICKGSQEEQRYSYKKADISEFGHASCFWINSQLMCEWDWTILQSNILCWVVNWNNVLEGAKLIYILWVQYRNVLLFLCLCKISRISVSSVPFL